MSNAETMTPIEAMARALCATKCAAVAEPPCWREDIGGDNAMKTCPDSPGCLALAQAALQALSDNVTDGMAFEISNELAFGENYTISLQDAKLALKAALVAAITAAKGK